MRSLDFLMSRPMQRVLGRTLLHPDQSFSLSELIRTAGSGRGGTQKLVQNLSHAGVLVDRRLGNQRLFSINKAHPIYPELRSIALKTFGLADRLRTALLPLADAIDLALIFGSMASGSEGPDSDIDLLVVGTTDLFEVSSLLSEAEKELGRSIHLNLVDPQQWVEWQGEPIGASIAEGRTIKVMGREP